MADEPGTRGNRATVIGLAVVLAMVVVLVGLAVWFVMRAGPTSTSPAEEGGFEQYREAYESAMAKAGIEAEFPSEPVPLDELRSEGSQPFDAVFTAEEATALLAMHPLSVSLDGEEVSLIEPSVSFGNGSVITIEGRVAAQGSRYRARIEGPVEFDPASGISSPGATEVRVEGFSANEGQRNQATELVVDFANSYLDAAPGLTVESVEIDAEGAAVTGQAPTLLLTP